MDPMKAAHTGPVPHRPAGQTDGCEIRQREDEVLLAGDFNDLGV
jgi:hypothetical protein